MLYLTILIARWLQFGSACALVGPLVYLTLSRPTDPAIRPGHLVSGPGWIAIWAVTLLSATLLGVIAQTSQMAGLSALAWDGESIGFVVMTTAFGLSSALRVILAAACLFAVAVLRPGKTRNRFLAGLGTAALASLAWAGHAGADDSSLGPVHLASDIFHLLAAALWLGAISVFCLNLMVRRSPVGDRQIEATLRALETFAGMGTLAVCVIVMSGIVNAVLTLGELSPLTLLSSTYGEVLGVKLLLFLAMVGLAGWHRFWSTPRLRLAIQSGKDPAPALRSLRLSLGAEAAAGLAVLLVVARLGSLDPGA